MIQWECSTLSFGFINSGIYRPSGLEIASSLISLKQIVQVIETYQTDCHCKELARCFGERSQHTGPEPSTVQGRHAP